METKTFQKYPQFCLNNGTPVIVQDLILQVDVHCPENIYEFCNIPIKLTLLLRQKITGSLL